MRNLISAEEKIDGDLTVRDDGIFWPSTFYWVLHIGEKRNRSSIENREIFVLSYIPLMLAFPEDTQQRCTHSPAYKKAKKAPGV